MKTSTITNTMKQQQKQQPSLPKPNITKFKVDPNFTVKMANPNVNNKKKKRSCENCRKRKVKCELVLQNQCSRCRKAGIECKLLQEQQQKPKKKRTGPVNNKKQQQQQERMESLEKRVQVLQQLLEEERKKNERLSSISTTCNCILPPGVTTAATMGHDDHVKTTTIDNDNNSLLNTQSFDLQREGYNNNDTPCPSKSDGNKSDNISPHQYRQTQDLIEDIPGLTPELTERILIKYFEFIHLNSPIIDRRTFQLQYYFDHPHPVDPRLFYAVCAVGCQYLPRQGDKSIARTISRVLREKAMAVMDTAYKESSLITVQVLLLISMITPHSNNDEGLSTHWLIIGAAIRMAQDLGIQADIHDDTISTAELQVRRRIAYALYVLDKISAASTGRPFTIKDEEFNVALPVPYEAAPDNDNNNLANLLSNGQQIPKLLQDTEKDIREKQPIYSGAYEAVRLSRLIAYVLSSFYYYDNSNNNTSKKRTLSTMDTNDLDIQLMTWKTNPKACYRAKDGKLYVGILYDSLLLLRYQPSLIWASQQQQSNNNNATSSNSTSFGSDDDATNYMEILNICTMIASRLIEKFEAWPLWGLAFLQDYMITQAAAIFLQNCNSQDNTIREQARKNLQRCANLYKQDDIVNSTKNAIVLNELVNQLSNEEKNNEKTTTTMIVEQGTTGLDIHSDNRNSISSVTDHQELSLIRVNHQIVDFHSEMFSAQQSQQSFFNDGPSSQEYNFNHLMLYKIM